MTDYGIQAFNTDFTSDRDAMPSLTAIALVEEKKEKANPISVLVQQ